MRIPSKHWQEALRTVAAHQFPIAPRIGPAMPTATFTADPLEN